MKIKVILGISAFYHDSAAALVVGGEIIAAAQEERFTRVKQTATFPVNSIIFCLAQGGYDINEIDAVVFYDKPLLKFERILETFYENAPRGWKQFMIAMPSWLHEKLFFKRLLFNKLSEVGLKRGGSLKLLFSEHHLSHAASAFFSSSFERAAILTIDGVGEWCTASIAIGENNGIKVLREMNFPNSVGLLYSAFTYFLGFKVNSGEYKLMGLAPYGLPKDDETLKFTEKIKLNLLDIRSDGSILLNKKYFIFSTSLRMLDDNEMFRLFGIRRRVPETAISQSHCNLALAIQTILEEIIIKMASEAKRITGADFLCMAGGVALNCVANGKLMEKNLFKDIFIQPAAGDAGGAIGAALAVSHIFFNQKRICNIHRDGMSGTYLGPSFSEFDIELMNKKTKAKFQKITDIDDLVEYISLKISNGNIVGWFQGRMEFGPRALGNRSILADPRNIEMKRKLNSKIKYRESFRPFAASVLCENKSDYFELIKASPYMLFTSKVRLESRLELPIDYQEYSILDRFNYNKSLIPAVTHEDFSSRIQTVSKEDNSRFWLLLNAFKKQTGVPLLVNTSFNVRGEPIVCSPLDAYQCFMSTEMDLLVIGDFVYQKDEQPEVNNNKWRVKYQND